MKNLCEKDCTGKEGECSGWGEVMGQIMGRMLCSVICAECRKGCERNVTK